MILSEVIRAIANWLFPLLSIANVSSAYFTSSHDRLHVEDEASGRSRTNVGKKYDTEICARHVEHVIENVL